MKDATEFKVVGYVDQEDPVVAEAEAELVSSLQRFHVALTGAYEAIDSR